MKNNHKLQITLAAGALALAAFILPNLNQENVSKRIPSSTKAQTKTEQLTKTPKQIEPNVKAEEEKIKAPSLVGTLEAPVPYFAKSENFKRYSDLLYKVVQTPEEKSAFNLSLLDNRSLEDAANFLKSPSVKPGKDEKINHLRASAYLIKAITAHPLEFEVTAAVKEILGLDLTAAKAQMTAEAYSLLKENKAELLYHALAVSEEIQESYVASYEDTESQNLLKNVQDLHSSNLAQSNEMIAER